MIFEGDRSAEERAELSAALARSADPGPDEERPRPRASLAVLFDDRTNLGLVRFYAQETGARLQAVMQEIASEEREGTLSGDFSSAGEAALDELF